MNRVVCIFVAFVLVFISSSATAECVQDIDCTGDLKCIDGECKSLDQGNVAKPVEVAPKEIKSEPEPAAEAEPSKKEPVLSETAPETAPVVQMQCGRDLDCKGVRICNKGVCEDPQQQAQPEPVDTQHDTRPPSAGWALGGAICGFVGMGAMTGLGAASAVTAYDVIPSVPLGASAVVTMAVMGPISFAGGKSARRGAGVRGALGLRITGWIAYGSALGNGLALIAVGASDGYVPPWLIALTTAIGDASLIMFSVDALVSRSQAMRVIKESAHGSNRPLVSLAPVLAPVYGPDSVSGGVLGLGGSF